MPVVSDRVTDRPYVFNLEKERKKVKQSKLLTTLVLLAMILVVLPAPMTAQEANTPPQLEWDGTWQYGPSTSFTFTRFDGEYYPGDGLVYFMGGRLASGTPDTDGSVWSFDPGTSLYADTGTDIPAPISNYKMNLLQDGSGNWGFYTFCGRPAGGGITGAVQVYYPDTNTAVQLPAADDYPGTGSCTSGLNVVYDNKAYVAGGFDPYQPGAPYNWDETWIFDPTAPSGSMWTQIPSATLNIARAYIMGAVVDDMIYAIGGNWYDPDNTACGQDLCNEPLVEVLDPNAATPVWDDASVADLPEECSSSRAYGFDTGVPYTDPDGTPFGGKIVSGCGWWSDENEHVYVYDTGLDSWEAFPYLQTDRRDHASAFVPSPTSGVMDYGVPAMWVWGGRKDADSNVLDSSEYYDVVGPSQPEFTLIPPYQASNGASGEVVSYTFTISNNLGMDQTFNMIYNGIWTVSGPATVGPIPDGSSEDFEVGVSIPAGLPCYESDIGTVTAVDPSTPLSDTSVVETMVLPNATGNLHGYVYDANTGTGIEDAYVYVEVNDDDNAETWTDASGYYSFADLSVCAHEGQYEAMGYFGQAGIPIIISAGVTLTQDITLVAAGPELSDDAVSVSVPPTSTGTFNLEVTNNGTGDLHFHVSEVPNDSGYPVPGPLTVPSMPSGIDAEVYADLAAAPEGTGKFVVYMAEQADLSAAFQIQDRSARGHYVLNTLRTTAERSQAGLQAELDRTGVEYESRYIVNALVVEGSASLADSLIARPEVAYIGPNAEIPAPEPVEMNQVFDQVMVPAWNVTQVNADDVWTDFGVTGEGIVVSNIDTGVLYTHTALVDQYRGTIVLTSGYTFTHDYNWWDPYGDQPNAPYDYHSHGSHTIGTMVGGSYNDTEIGMAPDGQWIACNGFDQGGSGYNAELLECAEFILAPWDLSMANADPDLRPDIVNNSWGGGQAQWWYNQAIYAWRAAGIFPVFSAGNDGPDCGTTGDPGDMPNVMAVGATTASDNIAGFSSRGPAAISGLLKPEVSAPGVGVISAYNTGEIGPMNGTSMAAPHVGGEAALLWSAVPDLRGDVQLTYWIIMQSTLQLTTTEGCGGDGPTDVPNNTFGWGRIDAHNAVSMALNINWDIPWLDVDPVGGVLSPTESADIVLTFDTTGLAMSPPCYTGTLKVEFNDPYITEQFVPVELCVAEAMYNVYLPVVLKDN